jgi:hypothetical protein
MGACILFGCDYNIHYKYGLIYPQLDHAKGAPGPGG